MYKLLLILMFVPAFLFAQNGELSKQEQADAYFQKKDYYSAAKLYRKLRKEVKKEDSAYGKITFGLSASLFYSLIDLKAKDEWQMIINESDEFIAILETDERFFNAELESKKYWAYKDLVVAYNALGQRDKAATYQQKLYDAHKSNLLPKGIDEYFNFDKFVYNTQNVWGYEWYTEINEPEAAGSFSKQVYYIYSRDSAGNDMDQLYTLQTVKVHKLSDDEPDFVLTKRTYNEETEQSESIWTFTFTNPVDHEKLHNAIVAFLKGGIQSDTKSIIKRK